MVAVVIVVGVVEGTVVALVVGTELVLIVVAVVVVAVVAAVKSVVTIAVVAILIAVVVLSTAVQVSITPESHVREDIQLKTSLTSSPLTRSSSKYFILFCLIAEAHTGFVL